MTSGTGGTAAASPPAGAGCGWFWGWCTQPMPMLRLDATAEFRVQIGQVSKPDHIFDRDREWEGLVRFATSGHTDARLGIVSGRRRQGKTYLLDAAATTFGGFFFTATDSTEVDSLADFGRVLAGSGNPGSGGRYEFADWDEALRRLFGTVDEGLIVPRCRSWEPAQRERTTARTGQPGDDHQAVRLPS